MDISKSFKGYGKLDEAAQRDYKRKTRKRLLLIVVSSLLLAVIIGALAGTLIHRRNASVQSPPTPTASALKSVCDATLYPDSCFTSMSEALRTPDGKVSGPEDIFNVSLRVVLGSLEKLSSLSEDWKRKSKDEGVNKAVDVCQTVLDDAVDRLNESIADGRSVRDKIDDLKTWLSTVITDQETCLDAIEDSKASILEEVKSAMKNSTEFASNSLAIVNKVLAVLAKVKIPMGRKLLEAGGFPDWVSAGDRRLLQVTPKPNVVVAQDGTGDVRTIKEAVARVPKKSDSRFIIQVKAGKYVENVILDKSLWNVMMVGDGKEKTIISGSLNFVDGTPTFSTATFVAVGRGFIAKDMGFINTAGPEKHQAVAMRSGGDRSVFYRCSFDAFQDTLYAHSNRQFFSECDITGTVDFIFGNAAVVFQKCNIRPRQPSANQFVTITAQGRKDPNQNTGIVIQKCSLTTPFDKLNAPTYLGRPWKAYSTTVIMQSDIGGYLNPVGWIGWVNNVEPPSTIFYGEYLNTGAGAAVDKRVKWKGYKSRITVEEASRFTVNSFIQGTEWLADANVVFDKAL